jgi:hypothetical protein
MWQDLASSTSNPTLQALNAASLMSLPAQKTDPRVLELMSLPAQKTDPRVLEHDDPMAELVHAIAFAERFPRLAGELPVQIVPCCTEQAHGVWNGMTVIGY